MVTKADLANDKTGGRKSPHKEPPAREKVKDLRAFIDQFHTHDAKTALIKFNRKGTETYTYEQLHTVVTETAVRLKKTGLEKGERAIFFAPNSPTWIVCALATIYAGGTVVPVDSQQSDEVLEHILSDSEAKIIFTDDKGSKRLEKLSGDESKANHNVILLDKDDVDNSWKKLGGQASNSGDDKSGSRSETEVVKPDDVALIFYTSGTTGMPKGVPLTHANMLLQVDSVYDMDLIKPSDRILAPLPLFHVYPLNIGLFVPFSMGLPIILPRSLTGPEIMRAIKEAKVTVLVGVPRLLRSLYQSIADRFNQNKVVGLAFEATMQYCQTVDRLFNLQPGKVLFKPVRKKIGETLRLFTCGGAPLDEPLAYKMRALGWDVAVGYGLSETAPLLTLRMPGDRDLASVGKPIEGVEVKIEKAKEADENIDKDAGEILARGANVFSGYLNRPDLNKEAFTSDGWFKTGDLGKLVGGRLHVIGRASSTIVMEGGEKIQPENVEDKIAKQPGIGEIGLLQVDHKLVALVVPDAKELGGGDEKEKLGAAIKEASANLASYLQITDFAISKEPLPRTNLGKIQRFKLKELYEQSKSSGKDGGTPKAGSKSTTMDSNDQALVEEPAAKACLDWLKKKFPDHDITLETSPQLDLNIDSLEWMNLTLELMETTGVELSGDAIGRVQTVRDLLKEISASGEEGGDAVSPLEDPEYYLNDEQKEFLRPLNPSQTAQQRIGYLSIMACMKPFRVEAVHAEQLTKKQYVFIPNHSSYLDPFIVAAALPFERLVNTQWAGWTGIAFGNPIFSFLSRLARVFPIEAKQSLFASIALGVCVLRQGDNLVWFPEGERTLDGKLLPFKKGIGLLLEKSDIDVVPLFLDGAREALPPGAFFPHFNKIRVIVGEPVQPKQLAEEGEGADAAEKIANALKARVQALSEQKKS